jgi:hypothetical protein
MKKFASKMAAIAATTVVSISAYSFADSEAVQIGLGYRQDSIKWKLEDFGVINPRADAHLHYRDLEIVLIGGKAKTNFGCNGYARVCFDYGWVLDGRLREKVELRDRSEAEHFRNNGVLVEGDYATATIKNREKGNSYVWDLNFAVGYPIDCGCSSFQFAPMIGFSWDRQHLKFKSNRDLNFSEDFSDGSFVVAVDDSSSSDSSDFPFSSSSSSSDSSRRDSSSHRSTFQTSYWGPWVGFDVYYNCQSCWNVFGEFELHFGRAERKANSRVGIDFLDGYSATKNFWGPTFRVGGNYNFCDCWYMEGAVSYLYWMSYGCRDRLYWSSATVRFDLGYIF